jgi:uncharacterized protein (TIGR02594 family)
MAILTKQSTDPVWLKNAFEDLGIKELSGRKHNARVVEMFHTSGFPSINDDETAWCAAAMGAWLIEGGYKASGSLMARSYSKYGKDYTSYKRLPRGTIVVFSRGGKNAPTGHVAICLEDNGTTITHIGGNQSNSVNISRTPKANLVAARWPNTASNSGTIQSIGGSTTALMASEGMDKASEAIAASPDVISETVGMAQPHVERLGEILQWAMYASISLGIGLAIYAAYRHYKNTVVA